MELMKDSLNLNQNQNQQQDLHGDDGGGIEKDWVAPGQRLREQNLAILREKQKKVWKSEEGLKKIRWTLLIINDLTFEYIATFSLFSKWVVG